MPSRSPVVLVIRDGWGQNPHPDHDAFNAIHLARTPVADELSRAWPTTLIRTSGEDVGLPAGTMGNSEVGHQNIGAGRIVDQELLRISHAITEGAFFARPALRQVRDHLARTGGRLHLLGLVSDGKVHSAMDHLFALIDHCAREGLPSDRLLIHAFTDGRDTGPTTGAGYIARLEEKLTEVDLGRIATVTGRYYAMDRDNRWERIARAYACLTGRPVRHPALDDPGVHTTTNYPGAILTHAYDHPPAPNRTGDEFVEPTQRIDARTGEPVGRIEDGDAVIFFNFRGDRPRQLTKAFVLDDDAWADVPNGGFDRGAPLRDLLFVTMTGYEQGLPVSAVIFDKPAKMPGILGQVVADAGLTQFRCAETEKFAHVTFFFNDYREEPFPGEHRLLVPSPTDVATYDQKPQMSADEVCAGVLDRLAAPDAEPLIIVNFANGDMVGHTGSLPATVRAVEVVDECVGRIVDAVRAQNGSCLITADHGNAEQMWSTEHDCPHTAHTTFDVPLIAVGRGCDGAALRDGGRLADLAPTALALLGLDQPAAMTGESLLV